MSWIKLNDNNGGTWAEEATPDPSRIITIDSVNADIANIQAQIDAIPNIDYPAGASDEIKEAIDNYNKDREQQRVILENDILVKQDILNELV